MRLKYQINTVVFALLVLFVSCKDSEHDHHALPAGIAAEGSLFDLEDMWTTQDDKMFHWKDQKGEPMIVSMFYASCQSVCPRIVSDMQRIAKQIEKKTGKQQKMVLVTFDPSVDSPVALKAYAKKMELGENWILLNGSDDSVRTISVLLGVSYQRTTGNDFNHSTVIFLLSKEGRIAARIEGIGADSSSIIENY